MSRHPAIALALILCTAPLLMGQAARPSPEQAQMQALAARAAKGLEALPSIRGRFVQTAPDGSMQAGTFHLWRPGRLRFEYDAPSPVLVVADGHNVKVADRRLKTVDAYPISATPLKVILSKSVRLDRDARIIRAVKGRDSVAITARDRKGEADGEITVVFDAQMTRLKEWTVTDGAGANTRVQLLSYGPVAPNAALFVLRGDVKTGGRPGR